MAFLIHSIANENVVPWEYFPCSDALIPGEVLVFKEGKLKSAEIVDLSGKPSLYLSMCEKGTGEEEIPAVRIRDDMILEGMAYPSEDGEISEGARGRMMSLASMGVEGDIQEARRTFHASHILGLIPTGNANSDQNVLFEVVGVMPPDSDDPEAAEVFPPKVLIRLIG